jgi:hypothetical protein
MPPVDATPTVVTLTKADVGLMLQGDSRGDMWLVPAYLFTTDKDDHVTAAAADDKYIEQPSPTTTPVDGGSGSGDSSGGSTGEGNTGDGTTVAPPVPPSNTNCSVVAAQAAGDNAGIDAQVCASSTSVKAGDKVVFTITAGDADRAFTDGPCGDGVLEEFGDGGDGTAHCAACATSVPDGPGKIERKREHTYTKAGAYTATFTITSGTTCAPSPKDSSATVSLRIAVS